MRKDQRKNKCAQKERGKEDAQKVGEKRDLILERMNEKSNELRKDDRKDK